MTIYKFFDDYDQERMPRDQWIPDYVVIGLDKILTRDALPRVRPVHLWYSRHDGKWITQWCTRAYKVEQLVKLEFRKGIERFKFLPEEVSYFNRVLILFAFARNSYQEAHRIRDEYFDGNDDTLIKDDGTYI
jgi:hypothetical protein